MENRFSMKAVADFEGAKRHVCPGRQQFVIVSKKLIDSFDEGLSVKDARTFSTTKYAAAGDADVSDVGSQIRPGRWPSRGPVIPIWKQLRTSLLRADHHICAAFAEEHNPNNIRTKHKRNRYISITIVVSKMELKLPDPLKTPSTTQTKQKSTK
uniref:Uncharacterized protein n=1 Tax=Kalanchoe fedtschenkoi TaxID=63787 RepID=A0A7N0VDN8_KALFE